MEYRCCPAGFFLETIDVKIMVNRKKHGATIRRKKTHRANKGLNYNKLTIFISKN